MSEIFDNEELLSQASCLVRVGNNRRGTAWLFDAAGGLLLTAAHVVLTDGEPGTGITVEFPDDFPRTVYIEKWEYNPKDGLDYAVLKLPDPKQVPRTPLPVGVFRKFDGSYSEMGYPAGEEGQSPAKGEFIGLFRRGNSSANVSFRLESTMGSKKGFSGAAIFSNQNQKVVAIHTEGAKNVVGAGANTVLAVPLYRIEQRWLQQTLSSSEFKLTVDTPREGKKAMDVLTMTNYASGLVLAAFCVCLLLFVNFYLRRSEIDLLGVRLPAQIVHLVLGPILITINMLVLVFLLGVLNSDITKSELTDLQATEFIKFTGPLFNPFYLSGKPWVDAVGYAFLIVLWWIGMHTFYQSVKLNDPSPLLASWNTVASGLYLVCGLASMLVIQGCFRQFGYEDYRLKHYFAFVGIAFGAFVPQALLTRSGVGFATIAAALAAILSGLFYRSSIKSSDTPKTRHDSGIDSAHSRAMVVWCSITGIFAGVGLGVISNSVNGYVSPSYFVEVMGWTDVKNVWLASIVQGAVEGGLYGAIFAGVFIVLGLARIRFSCSTSSAIRYLLGVVLATIVLWTLGGTVAAVSAYASPEYWARRVILIEPSDVKSLMSYAWVAGSIMGGVFGGVGALIMGIVLLKAIYGKASSDSTLQHRQGS